MKRKYSELLEYKCGREQGAGGVWGGVGVEGAGGVWGGVGVEGAGGVRGGVGVEGAGGVWGGVGVEGVGSGITKVAGSGRNGENYTTFNNIL